MVLITSSELNFHTQPHPWHAIIHSEIVTTHYVLNWATAYNNLDFHCHMMEKFWISLPDVAEEHHIVTGLFWLQHMLYSCRRGRKGGPKTAKPHRNTPKNRKPHQIFSWIPKPHVHGGPLYESGHQQDLWYILITLWVNIKLTIITLTVYCPKLLYCTVLFTTNQMPSMWVMYLNECYYLAWLWKNCLWSCTSCTGWLITLDDLVLVVERDLSCSWIKAMETRGYTAVRANTRHGISRCRRITGQNG